MSIPYGPILVVEDVPHILELLEVTLKFKGYPVMTARNGQEALELMEREHPALVITDILMPKMDGYSLVQRLRTNPKTNQVPIIFLSATYVTPEDKAFALRLGAMRFLEKPVDTEDFLLTIAEVLTGGTALLPPPLEEREFFTGYRMRLEHKLRHKLTQINRTERLLENLPAEQKPTFEALLNEARQHRKEIQEEVDQLHQLLSQHIKP
ncbi:MAG: response regulator [Anaerolineales bacterium]|nr:MAG: response regulator [Anaerolineales bacterium]